MKKEVEVWMRQISVVSTHNGKATIQDFKLINQQ